MEGTRAGCWWWQWVCVICRRAGFHSLHSSTMRRLDSDQGDNFSHVFNHNHLMLSLGLLSRTLKRAGLSLNLSIIEVRSTFLIVIKRAQNTAPLTTSSTKFHLMMMAQPADQVLPLNKLLLLFWADILFNDVLYQPSCKRYISFFNWSVTGKSSLYDSPSSTSQIPGPWTASTPFERLVGFESDE